MSNSSFWLALVIIILVLTAGLVVPGPATVVHAGVLVPVENPDDPTSSSDDDDRASEDEDFELEADEEKNNEGIEELVRDIFDNDEVMIRIARCESGFRQYAPNGDVLTNPRLDEVVGVFQIHEDYHEEPAEELGYDIYTAWGNIHYAEHLYETEGIRPWGASSICWDEDNDTDEIEDREGPITFKLVIGTRHDQVQRLQEILNESGFELADEGPGSPGEETRFFGNRTQRSVRDLQCAYDIVCEGSEYTTGYGMVDEETREVINTLAQGGDPERERDGGSGILLPHDPTSSSSENDGTSNGDPEDISDMSRAEMLELIEELRVRVRQLAAQLR